MTSDRGLTPLLCALVRATPAERAAARGREEDVAKKHGLSVEIVRFNLGWMEGR